MKIIKNATVISLALLILSGCSGFQLASKNKKVIVDAISPNTTTVTFCGNAYMNQKEVEKYALQRASSETLSKGCSNFVVVKKEDNSKICALNSTMNKKYSSDPSVAETAAGAYASTDFVEPNVTLTIQCIREGEEIPEKAINAENFLNENFPGLRK